MKLHLIKKLFPQVQDFNPMYAGKDTTLKYTKSPEDWSIEDRKQIDKMIVKKEILGLERRVKTTVLPEQPASLTEVFQNAKDEVTKSKFE